MQQAGGGELVERVEDMQSAPTAAAGGDEEPASSVISAEEQQALVRAPFVAALHARCQEESARR